jgi:hypothetical protein
MCYYTQRAFVVSRIEKSDTTETGATSNEKRVTNVFRSGDYRMDLTVRVLTEGAYSEGAYRVGGYM